MIIFVFLTKEEKMGTTLDETKMYYTMKEVAAHFDVNTSLIRFWEKEFPTLNPYRNKKGTRYYTKADIDIFKTIYYLVKEKGYTLQGAKEILAVNKSKVDNQIKMRDSLLKIRMFLLSLKSELDR